MRFQGIKVNVVTGFLGAGKTTVIKNLLAGVPQHEKWAVLVNEFGEVGIDGDLLKQDGVAIKQVPGGCLCCVTSAAFSVGLNELIKQAKPDRIIIEPTGIGHPHQIVEQLSADHYRDVLDIRGTVCLMDARNLSDPRYLGHPAFFDQIDDADVLIGSKADLYDDSQEQRFLDFAKQFAASKSVIALSSNGQCDPAWLDLPRASHNSHHDHDHDHDHDHAKVFQSQPVAGVTCYLKREQGMASVGWIAESSWSIDDERFEQFLALIKTLPNFWRFKGVLRLESQFELINVTQGESRRSPQNEGFESRFECIFADDANFEENLLELQKLLF